MPNALQIIRTTRSGPTVFGIDAPGGVAGNLATLRQMAQIVRDDRLNENLRQFVHHQVIARARPHDFTAEVDACFDWLKRNVTYRRDAWGTQRVADLATTIRTRTANCISLSVALATMLALIGKKPAFVVLAQQPWGFFGDGEFDHVYVCVDMDGQCYPLDPTPEDARPWQVYGRGERRQFAIF